MCGDTPEDNVQLKIAWQKTTFSEPSDDWTELVITRAKKPEAEENVITTGATI